MQRHISTFVSDDCLASQHPFPFATELVCNCTGGDDAWNTRHNMTFADALYVALAVHLNAPFLSNDLKLANAPTLPVRILRL